MEKDLDMRIPLIIAMIATPISCTNKKASWETQEDSRRQAIENATFSAQKWRRQHAADYRLIARGDSTISATCPQGDGWASMDLEKDGVKIKLKCSTVSESIGCMPSADFKKRTYAEQEGRCNKEIPFPLPKIVK